MGKIGENTPVTLTVVAVMLSAIFFVGSSSARQETRIDNHDARLDKQAEKIKKQEEKEETFDRDVTGRLARIEQKLDDLINK